MDTLSPVISLIAGLILLFTGRRVFWLAAALAAFMFAYRLLIELLGPGVVSVVVAIVAGLIFVGLALSFIRTIGFIIGALAGAVGVPILLGLFGIHWAWWIMALIGAVIGVIVIFAAFDWGLVLMTSWLGANLVAGAASQLFGLPGGIAGLGFALLLVIGIVAQSTGGGGKRG